MTEATRKSIKDMTGFRAQLNVMQWLNIAQGLPLTEVGIDRDFALSRADWWLGIWMDLEHKREK